MPHGQRTPIPLLSEKSIANIFLENTVQNNWMMFCLQVQQ